MYGRMFCFQYSIIDDACAGIVTWTFDDCNIEGECYFILPNVCIDGNKATIIKLKRGITIKIDARIIMHCSSLLFNENNNNVYGTFFGAKQP